MLTNPINEEAMNDAIKGVDWLYQKAHLPSDVREWIIESRYNYLLTKRKYQPNFPMVDRTVDYSEKMEESYISPVDETGEEEGWEHYE